MKISEVKKVLAQVTTETDPQLAAYEADPRKGVQCLVQQTKRRLTKQREAEAAFEQRLHFEKELWQQGIQYVAGVDEVGRGPLAGPVVIGAVILPHDFALVNVNDSKQLTDHERRGLAPLIKQTAVAYQLVSISPQTIDQINIYEASRLGMKRAIEQLQPTPEHLLVDAMVIDTDLSQTKLIKGDAKSASIAAASILAKVARDDLMIKYADQYPEYGFDHNDGYGTKEHLQALRKFGATPIHRKSFAPVRDLGR
ncbi:ribonuclease HII [Fructilactobacillus cliffordii]|uniref:Ribonuclease HII n=1 Tax=Fructilactobacillus cliffordii TaxID=2940299 RepID=A0A9Q8ZUS1_9LACO|nr:ribonuclease HII [Fructilactobacillus cliffordii]USS89627.1 ribonuclease HII [Fructilactobacillus cliffordii]